jgi:hypothetical protein
VVQKSPGGARLESGAVALGLGVEGVERREDGVDVLAGTAVVDVDVGVDVTANPEGLGKAQNLGSRFGASGACLSQLLGKSRSLNQGTVRG